MKLYNFYVANYSYGMYYDADDNALEEIIKILCHNERQLTIHMFKEDIETLLEKQCEKIA